MLQLSIGDTVRLKSGGPIMTVHFFHDGDVHCQWFAGSTLEHGVFPPASLERITESQQ